MKRVNVFVGNYGSGKTELSVNAALLLRETYEDVALADADIVNPYFRASEQRALLEARGVRVFAPEYASTGVDLPTLPPGVAAAISGRARVVVDCGGDPAGATALGALQPYFETARAETEVYFVLNACRPLQRTAREAVEMARGIEAVCRLRVTGVINNTNMAGETEAAHLAAGQEIARKAARALGVPVCYVAGTAEALDAFAKLFPRDVTPRFPLRLYTRPYWL